jgi:hypothetical protein
VAVAGALWVPATPAFAHGGDAPDATAYRTAVTGISAPEKGLRVRTVEAGARLELSNTTGHPVEVLGYSGEPYLDVRPDGTWQNVNSPAAYVNATLTGETPVPATADPTAPPSWRRVSTSTTVRWHDQRTHWLGAARPSVATADPGRRHRLRDWAVPLRVQTRTLEIRGTLDWEPPPRAGLWWLGAGSLALAVIAAATRWPRSVAAVTVIGGLAPISYATTRALEGGATPLVMIVAGLLAVAAGWRRPPFYLLLSGAVLTIFGGLSETESLRAAVVPAAGPGWAARLAVVVAIGVGAGVAATGALRLRAARRPHHRAGGRPRP